MNEDIFNGSIRKFLKAAGGERTTLAQHPARQWVELFC
jgi:hypothetical protein